MFEAFSQSRWTEYFQNMKFKWISISYRPTNNPNPIQLFLDSEILPVAETNSRQGPDPIQGPSPPHLGLHVHEVQALGVDAHHHPDDLVVAGAGLGVHLPCEEGCPVGGDVPAVLQEEPL